MIKNPKSSANEKIYQKLLRDYARDLNTWIGNKNFKTEAEEKKVYIHLSRIVDCMAIDETFSYERNGVVFNFRNYYSDPQTVPVEQLRKEVIKKFSII